MVNLFETDIMAGEKSTDGDAVSVPADAAVRTDEPGFEVARVGEGLESPGEGSGRGAIEVGG